MPCHAKAYIRVFRYSVPQNGKSFARENLSENKFLTALILYESKNSGGSIILFLMTSLLKPAKLSSDINPINRNFLITLCPADNIFIYFFFKEWLFNIDKDNKISPIGFWKKNGAT